MQARPTFPATVAGKDTTVIEIGPEGEPIRSGSAKALADVAQVLVVVDPRALSFASVVPHWGRSGEFDDDDLRAKTTTFLLMPSVTSSPDAMLCAEVALQALGLAAEMQIRTRGWVKNGPITDLRLVRLDDYLAYGFDILVAMMEQGKKVYPAEKADDMLGFLKPIAELEEASGTWYYETGYQTRARAPSSRFVINLYNYRGWSHWALSQGLEEGDIMEAQMECVGLLEDAGQHLSSSSISSQPVSSGLRAVLPTKMRRVPITFSASAAKKCAAFGSVAVCESFTSESLSSQHFREFKVGKAIADLFTMLDTNQDGEIDEAEQEEAMKYIHSLVPPKALWTWSVMDTDGDWKISLKEFHDGMQAISDKVGEKQLLACITQAWTDHPLAIEKAAAKVAWEKMVGRRKGGVRRVRGGVAVERRGVLLREK